MAARENCWRNLLPFSGEEGGSERRYGARKRRRGDSGTGEEVKEEREKRTEDKGRGERVTRSQLERRGGAGYRGEKKRM